ncbi:MAG TPA: ABC transporter permease subunit [Planctomycetota bacterium]|nr:ABC transporter permease subunit [Planctomycetota bacterium]
MLPDPPPRTQAGGPAPRVRPPLWRFPRAGRRRVADRLARGVVTLGGVAVIGSILAILVVLVAEVAPLFRPARIAERGGFALAPKGPPLIVGVDEYREVLYVATIGGLRFFDRSGALLAEPSLSAPAGTSVGPVSDRRRGSLALTFSDGSLLPVEIVFRTTYGEQGRSVRPEVRTSPPVRIAEADAPLLAATHSGTEDGLVAAAAVAPRRLAIVRRRQKRALVGPGRVEEARHEVDLPGTGRVVALAVDGRGEDLFAGTTEGTLVRVDLRGARAPQVVGTQAVTPDGAGVSVLGFLLGDRTLIVGDVRGRLSGWGLVRGEGDAWILRKYRDFAPHGAAMAGFQASSRDKGFLTWDVQGEIRLHHGTTGRTVAEIHAGPGAVACLAPKGDGIFAVDPGGRVRSWDLSNPHPEVTLGTLFGRVWYEGYERPEFVWQSTGGTDDFEPKLSLVPLVYGTLKGTFYALLFAAPLALLAALYVSQFMHPSLRSVVKPVVEIMAALPSVVLGFLAGLWLAPRVERWLPGLLLAGPLSAGLLLAGAAVWRRLPAGARKWIRPGREIVLVSALVGIGLAVSLPLGAWLERAAAGGDYRNWLREVLGLSFDQRNSIVVGIAMGFAVIPVIFTIAEDSLSGVPGHLTAGSLALGATRWQTAIRVVLPTASPGIFSAVMVGFGRAVGETMIVLMATGNTPILSPSPFNGFRALSANIAVELPEAPHGSTLYRVLFLAALLLFAMTFAANTVAELVRLRLRRRYQSL